VETRIRVERSITREQILVPLTRSHRAFYLREAGILPSQRIVQPANKGTAPPILHGLRSVARQDHEALVAVLPCDHHYLDEPAFTAALECPDGSSIAFFEIPPAGVPQLWQLPLDSRKPQQFSRASLRS
jgi:mannose-1-phosphate guanylyltransferase